MLPQTLHFNSTSTMHCLKYYFNVFGNTNNKWYAWDNIYNAIICFISRSGIVSLCLNVHLRHVVNINPHERRTTPATTLNTDNNVWPPPKGAVGSISNQSGTGQWMESDLRQAYKLTSAMAKIGVFMLYCFVADR